MDIRNHGGNYGRGGNSWKGEIMNGINIMELPSPITVGNNTLKVWDDKLFTADARDYIRYWKLNKTTKQWGNQANYNVYPRDLTGYSDVIPHATVFSKDNEYIYVMAKCNTTKVYYYTLQINLTNSVIKQIGISNTSTNDIPWILYADATYFYYYMNNRIYKAKANDLSDVTSSVNTVSWNTDIGQNQYQYYCATNNTVYNIGNGHQLEGVFTGINLTTLTVTSHKIPNNYRNAGAGGFWCDGTYFYMIGTGISSSPYSYNFIKVQLGGTAAVVNYSKTSQLQNPFGFSKGMEFQSILFYDKKTQLLWVRTTDFATTSSYMYQTSKILIGIDLSTFTIKDSVWLGSQAVNNNSLDNPSYYYHSGMMHSSENNKIPVWYQPSMNIFKQLIPKK